MVPYANSLLVRSEPWLDVNHFLDSVFKINLDRSSKAYNSHNTARRFDKEYLPHSPLDDRAIGFGIAEQVIRRKSEVNLDVGFLIFLRGTGR
jgi:hypothetical protein